MKTELNSAMIETHIINNRVEQASLARMIAHEVNGAEGYISEQRRAYPLTGDPDVLMSGTSDCSLRIRNEANDLLQRLTPLILEWDSKRERVNALARLREESPAPGVHRYSEFE